MRKNRRAAGRPARRRQGVSVAMLFPGLRRRKRPFGAGVLIAFAECRGGRPSLRLVRRESFSNHAGEGLRTPLLGMVAEEELARVLAGFAQRSRVGVLRAILSGANTHAALKHRTGLAAGPLYHHLRSLERAGLVVFVERNRYDVSQLGRDLIMLATVACADANQRLTKKKPNVP